MSKTNYTETSSLTMRLLFDFALIVVTAFASWIITHYQITKQQDLWLEQQQILNRGKLYETRLTYLNRLQKDFYDYRSTSYLWFFSDLSLAAGHSEPDANSRHVAFHSIESELQSCLRVCPYFYGKNVKQAVDNLNQYFAKYPWEGIVQSPEFTSKAIQLFAPNAPEDITTMINRGIHLNEYVTLSNALVTAMAEDISQDMRNQ